MDEKSEVKHTPLTEENENTQPSDDLLVDATISHVTPTPEHQSQPDEDADGVQLKKEISLFNGITVIVGSIIGSGIFISPKGVLNYSGSVGLSLLVWAISGIFSLVGALCYAELGTTIAVSGGEYSYIYEAFGELPAFVLLWVTLIVINPTGQAVVALTFAYYVVQPFYPDPDCPPPDEFIRIAALLCLTLLTFINCWSVPWSTKVQDIFTIAKLLALVIIIIAGLAYIGQGHTENFKNSFENKIGGDGSIALAFYNGLFAYAGWNYLNYLTEEIKDSPRNLPWAIIIALPLVTLVYVLANVAYFAVLAPEELMLSNAVAVSFAVKVLGPMAWIIPFGVALSTFGAVNGGILSQSRLFFVGAREGQLPKLMGMIHVKRCTPLPSIFFTCILSCMYVFVSEIDTLINYFSFVTWLAIGIAVCGLIYLRFKKPELERPFKLNIFFPIIFVLACLFLTVMGVIDAFLDTIIGLVITLTAFPIYFLCIRWTDKPVCFLRMIASTSFWFQKLFMVVGQQKLD
ncbi:Y+L amino acid transporter 2-like [Anneissia japonica]|uniref:Y+L amino acid transporter 2-like n=1 Tax=Anneissia japonica TaxID=1529436 RepID=UPI001425AA3F|nr:Y+L amino acid transporter 2-like [Anneissia japonica]